MRPRSGKPLQKKEQAAFWKRFDSGKVKQLEKRAFVKFKKRAPVFIDYHRLGVIHRFRSAEALEYHIECVRRLNNAASQTRFRTFLFQPTRILSIDETNLRTLEQVHHGPDIYTLTSTNPNFRQQNVFFRKFALAMKKKGVELSEVQKAAETANHEFLSWRRGEIAFDRAQRNILVLDYNPKTKKPLLAVVAHGFSISAEKNS